MIDPNSRTPNTSSRPELRQRLASVASSIGNISGDIVELGVFDGMMSAALNEALPGRRAWLYDNFEGMPIPTERDGEEAFGAIGRCAGREDVARALVEQAGAREVVVRKGLFQDTVHLPLPESIAFLNIDADWYESVLIALRVFAPLVNTGGIISIDDWFWWPGAKLAFYDWVNESGERPLVRTFGDNYQMWWIKGQEIARGN